MKYHLKILVPVLLCCAPWLHGQITNDIKARIDHSFMVGEKTMPAGNYTFHMVQSSGLALMRATNNDTNATIEFGVRQTDDKRSPAHSKLVFRKYGDTEVLVKVFERGQTTGAELTDAHRAEARLAKQGEPTEHSEEQP